MQENFSQILIQNQFWGTAGSGPLSLHIYPVGWGSTAYWRVGKLNGDTWTFEPVWKFSITPLPTPGNNTTIPIARKVTLRWMHPAPYDDYVGTRTYKIVVSPNRDNMTRAYFMENGKQVQCTASDTTTCCTMVYDLVMTPGTTYYWSAGDVAPNGYVNLGPIWSFKTPSAVKIPVKIPKSPTPKK